MLSVLQVVPVLNITLFGALAEQFLVGNGIAQLVVCLTWVGKPLWH